MKISKSFFLNGIQIKTILALCTIAIMIVMFHSILSLFLWGWAMAYIARPLVSALERQGISTKFSSIMMMIAMYTLVASFVLILFPLLREMFMVLSRGFAEYRHDLSDIQHPWVQHLWGGSAAKIQQALSMVWTEASKWITNLLVYFLQNTLAFARFSMDLVLAPVISFHFMKDWKDIHQRFLTLFSAEKRSFVAKVTGELDTSLRRYLGSQLSVSLFLALYYGVSLALEDIPSGLTVGILTGLSSFIPYIGFLSGLIATCCLSLFHWGIDMHLLLAITTYITGAIIESLILTPWLVGSRSGLHPLWVLFAVFSGGSIAGISGVLIALPLATILASLWRMERRGDLRLWWRESKEASPSFPQKPLK